jgi:hypothetical protein
MILPGMGVISELISNFSRKKIFGYEFIAFSSIAIAVFGFPCMGPSHVRQRPVDLCRPGIFVPDDGGGGAVGDQDVQLDGYAL